MSTKALIPGNRYPSLKIQGDFTLEYLQDRLRKVTGAQKANMRSNPAYRAEVRRLKQAIAARS